MDVAVDVPDDVSDVVAPTAHTILQTVFKPFPLTCVPCTAACTAWIVACITGNDNVLYACWSRITNQVWHIGSHLSVHNMFCNATRRTSRATEKVLDVSVVVAVVLVPVVVGVVVAEVVTEVVSDDVAVVVCDDVMDVVGVDREQPTNVPSIAESIAAFSSATSTM